MHNLNFILEKGGAWGTGHMIWFVPRLDSPTHPTTRGEKRRPCRGIVVGSARRRGDATDEFGYVPTSQVGGELLFDVISTAYERTSVLVTTNLPFERWTEVLGNERLVAATLDRLTHRCHLLEATGESYRLREARERQRASESQADGGRRRKRGNAERQSGGEK